MNEVDGMFLRWIIGFSVLFVLRDWFIIEIKKKSPNHGRGLTMRAFISIAISFVISDSGQTIVENLMASFFIVGFIFMYGLNIARKKPLLYLNPESDVTDKILVKIFRDPLAIFVFALIGFIAAIAIKIMGIKCMVYGGC